MRFWIIFPNSNKNIINRQIQRNSMNNSWERNEYHLQVLDIGKSVEKVIALRLRLLERLNEAVTLIVMGLNTHTKEGPEYLEEGLRLLKTTTNAERRVYRIINHELERVIDILGEINKWARRNDISERIREGVKDLLEIALYFRENYNSIEERLDKGVKYIKVQHPLSLRTFVTLWKEELEKDAQFMRDLAHMGDVERQFAEIKFRATNKMKVAKSSVREHIYNKNYKDVLVEWTTTIHKISSLYASLNKVSARLLVTEAEMVRRLDEALDVT
jgi:hypothetical protein